VVSDEADNPNTNKGSGCSIGSKQSDRVGYQTPTLDRQAFLLDSIHEVMVMLIRVDIMTTGMFQAQKRQKDPKFSDGA
jgi:hypothetical protein